MSEVKWIKIVTDIFEDEKILLIESMPEADGLIVIWFKLLCLAGKQNNSGVFMMNGCIPYTAEMFATIFRRPVNTVRLAFQVFEQYGMIRIVNDAVTLPNWEKHQTLDQLEMSREKTRQRVAKHREKQKRLANGNVTDDVTDDVTAPVTETLCNADRIDKMRIDKKRIERDTDPAIETDPDTEKETYRDADNNREIKRERVSSGAMRPNSPVPSLSDDHTYDEDGHIAKKGRPAGAQRPESPSYSFKNNNLGDEDADAERQPLSLPSFEEVKAYGEEMGYSAEEYKPEIVYDFIVRQSPTHDWRALARKWVYYWLADLEYQDP